MELFLRVVKRGGALFLLNPVGFAGYEEAEGLGITVSSTQVRSNGPQLEEAGKLLDDGTIRVTIDSIYLLNEVSRAHERAIKGCI